MGTTIESLELEIQSKSTSAVSGIDALTQSLGKLKLATKGGLGLTSVVNQLGKLDTALKNVDSTAGTKITSLAQGLEKLSKVGNVKISSSIGNQIKNIGAAASSLKSSDLKNLGDLPSALQPLASLSKASGLKSAITQLKQLPELAKTLNGIDWGTFTRQLSQLSSALAPLANQLNIVSTAFSKLPTHIKNTVSATSKIASENQKASNSYVNLWAKMTIAINAVMAGARVLAGWITNASSYVETVNLFSVSMGQYAAEAKKYADTVGEVMGIDPAEFMQYEGVLMTITQGFGVASEKAYLMSKNLTQLGYDLASFYNIGTEDAMQKIQSGISGELEPLRRLGYDLSVARLQQEAYNLGIDRSVNSMTQAEKAQLRYYAIMTQVSMAHGDMARTLDAPMNQIRVLKAQVTQCARAFGQIFIPVLNAVLPYAIALANVLRYLAAAIASLFGIALPSVDFSSMGAGAAAMGGMADSADDAAGGMGKAADEAKKLKNALLGIDELNVITPNTDTSSGSGGGGGIGGGGGGGLDFDLPTYDFLGDAINTKVDEIIEKFKDWLGLSKDIDSWIDLLDTRFGRIVLSIGAVGAAFATWKVSQWLAGLFGVSDLLGALVAADYFSILSGMILTLGGAVLYLSGTIDVWKDGMNWGNLVKILAGMAGAITGVYLAVKPFSTVIAPIAAAATAAATGFGLLYTSLLDMRKNRTNIKNLIGSLGGLATAVAGLSIALKGSSLAIAPVIAPLVAFNGALAIMRESIIDIVLNGTSFSNIFGVIAGGVAAVTAAVILWNAACAINPILAIGMIVIGIVGAIKAIADAVKNAGEEAYRASEDYQIMQNIIDDCAEASERCTSALNNMETGIAGLDNVSNDFATASVLLDEIFAINDNANASAYELEQMAVKVDILNGLGIEGLTLSIDETTGRVIQTREEVEKLIASLEREAKMEAMRDLLVQSYRDQFVAMKDRNQAARDYEAAQEALLDTQRELENTPWWDLARHSALTAEQKKQTEALHAARDTLLLTDDTYNALTDTISIYTDEITNMKLEEIGVGDELVNGLGDVGETLDETSEKMNEYGADIAEGLRNGIDENTQEAEYKSIWEKIGDWFKGLFGIHSPSTVFKEYGEFMAEGLIEGLKSTPDKFSQVASEWVEDFKKSISEKLSNVKNLFSGVNGSNIDVKADVSLVKKGWTTVSAWIGRIPIVNQMVGLLKQGWTTVKNWIGTLPTISQLISLLKSGWTTVKNWIGHIPVLSQGISLLKSGWTTVKSWIGFLPVISQGISLLKSGWSTVKNWVDQSKGGETSQGVGLAKSGWWTVANWVSDYIGGSVSVTVNLLKGWYGSIKNWLGLSSGGTISASGAFELFKNGGYINSNGMDWWNSVPKYANGTATAGAHGTMFVAGEAGPEIVGHVNGQSEVLNKSQLAAIMHSSVVAGMSQFVGYWRALNSQMAVCTNAIISSIMVNTDVLNARVATCGGYQPAYAMAMTGYEDSKRAFDMAGDNDSFEDNLREFYHEYVEPVLREIADDTKRQADKEEQTVVKIGDRVITDTVDKQKKANGYSFTK